MLNAHVFVIAPHPGLAPELALRSGQGGWEAHALAAPADRLLPFVLTRLRTPANAAWVNCASIVHADTEEVLFTLNPTGQTAGGPSAYGLVLAKVIDAENQREHFLYYGAIIPGLTLPCGVPLRLLLDNAWQSPRFIAYQNLTGFQMLEWHHPGSLSGIPYGTGLVQRLYVENGGLQYVPPREVKTTSQDATTGGVRIDYYAKYRRATTNVSLVPRYLCEAVDSAQLHGSFSVDGEFWRVEEVKETLAGPDGGRWNLALTLEQQQVLQARPACPPAPLAPEVYDPVADAPRGWRCGDASDTAPDYGLTGNSSCDLDDNGRRTGYVLAETSDRNPNSGSYGQTSYVRTYDPVACPLPVLFYSVYYAENATKNDCADGQTGSTELFASEAGKFSSYDSQKTADDQAVAYVQAGKQAYANSIGTCSVVGGGGTQYYPMYVESGPTAGCFSCQMVNGADPTDRRDATADEVSLYYQQRPPGSTQNCPLCLI